MTKAAQEEGHSASRPERALPCPAEAAAWLSEFGTPGPGQRRAPPCHRAGPGMTPVIQWEGPGLGAYDPAKDEQDNLLFDRFVGTL